MLSSDLCADVTVSRTEKQLSASYFSWVLSRTAIPWDGCGPAMVIQQSWCEHSGAKASVHARFLNSSYRLLMSGGVVVVSDASFSACVR